VANPYLEMELRTAPPELIVGRLLDRAVAMVRTGMGRLETGPVESTAAIAKAVDIVSELRGALDLEAGGETAGNLDALYEFAAGRLVLGRATLDRAALAEALQVIETLASGWSEMLAQQREGAA
jgi:flagellar protein FliS